MHHQFELEQTTSRVSKLTKTWPCDQHCVVDQWALTLTSAELVEAGVGCEAAIWSARKYEVTFGSVEIKFLSPFLCPTRIIMFHFFSAYKFKPKRTCDSIRCNRTRTCPSDVVCVSLRREAGLGDAAEEQRYGSFQFFSIRYLAWIINNVCHLHF